MRDTIISHQSLVVVLVDKSLLQQPTPERYTVHELLRQFSAEKLAERPAEEAAVRRRHARYYTQFLKQREDGLKGVRQREALADIEMEFGNIRTAWRWAVAHGDHRALDDAIWALVLWIEVRGRPEVVYPLFELATREYKRRSNSSPESRLVLAKMQAGEAWSLFRLGDPVRAAQLLASSSPVIEQFGSSADVALVHMALGATLAAEGELLTARERLQTSLALFRELGDRWGIAGSIFYLGEIAWLQGDLEGAERCYRKILAESQATDDVTGNIWCLRRLGDVALAQGELEEAKRLYGQGLALAEEMNNVQQHTLLLLKLGAVTRERDEYESAWCQIQRALRTASESLLVPLVLAALVEMGRLMKDLGRAEKALHLLDIVRHHAASRQETRQQADALFAELASGLPADVVVAGEESAHTRALADIVDEILTIDQVPAHHL